MDIKDIQANQGNIDVICDVVRKDSIREFEKFGKVGKVCNATLADATGDITFSLWNDDIEKYNVGDKLHITGGWCSEFKGNKQLSAGKYGKVEIVGKATIAATVTPAVMSGVGGAALVTSGSGSAVKGQRDLFSTPVIDTKAASGTSSSGSNSSGYGGSSGFSGSSGSGGYSNRASTFKYSIDEGIELLTPAAKSKPLVEIPKKKVYDPYDDGDEKVRSEELDEEAEETGHDTDEEYVE